MEFFSSFKATFPQSKVRSVTVYFLTEHCLELVSSHRLEGHISARAVYKIMSNGKSCLFAHVEHRVVPHGRHKYDVARLLQKFIAAHDFTIDSL